LPGGLLTRIAILNGVAEVMVNALSKMLLKKKAINIHNKVIMYPSRRPSRAFHRDLKMFIALANPMQ
jgi:hypothetical protein